MTILEREMNNDFKYPVCPRCGGFIPNNYAPGAYPGALSRLDNKTEVCSDCGIDESIEQYYNGKVTDWNNSGSGE